MSRFLFVTYGTLGDTAPHMTLALQLKARGHDVAFLGNEMFRDRFARAGLAFSALDGAGDFEAITLNRKLVGANFIGVFGALAKRGALPAAGRTIDHLLRYEDPKQTLLVAGSLAFGARLAQDLFGFRAVSVHLQPAPMLSAFDPPPPVPRWMPVTLRRVGLDYFDRIVFDSILVPELERLAAAHGFKRKLRNVWSKGMSSPDGVLALFPEWFAAPQPDWPADVATTGFIAGPGAGAPTPPPDWLRAELEGGSRPIVFTPGSAVALADTFFAVAAEICTELKQPALFLTPHTEQLPAALPASVRHVPFVDFSSLLPHASAIVHPGGIGTIAHALAAGIPQLLVPFHSDQPDNAVRLERLGAALVISPRRFSPTTGARLMRRLLSDQSIAERSRELGSRIDFAASVEAACQFLEAHAEALLPVRINAA